MKKIGILTFHNADNLGAVLQAYALQTAVKENCNLESEIIDYRCEHIEKSRFPTSRKSGIKGFIKYLCLKFYYSLKRSSFDGFRRRYLKVSKNRYHKENVKECDTRYDGYVVGSDQVWNLECTDSDLTYYLDFTHKPKWSYAASFGNYEISAKDNKLNTLLTEFKKLSVREITGINKLKELGIDDARVDLDPVFLLKKERWEEIIPDRIIKKKYVFVYMIIEDSTIISKAMEFAKNNDCKIISNKQSIEFITHNRPDAFLSWIRNAEVVFTNSFHGAALSILFNKKAVISNYLPDGRINERINDLIKLLHAEHCIMGEHNNPLACNANKVIDDYRLQAIKYLKSMKV